MPKHGLFWSCNCPNILFYLNLVFYFMHIGVLSAFMNVYHVHHRNQKMAWDSLEVMFQTVTSSHVGAGNQTQSPGRAASALKH